MKELMRKYSFTALSITLTTTLLSIFSHYHQAIAFLLSVLFFLGPLVIKNISLKRLCLLIGFLLLLLAVVPTASFWMSLLVAVTIHGLFKTQYGSELVTVGEMSIHPFPSTTTDSKRRMIDHQSSLTQIRLHQPLDVNDGYEWEDVNVIHLAGNSLIDLDNTMVPEGETLIVLRKLIGKTRVIIPKELGLKLNVSALSGSVYLNQEKITLSAENYQYITPTYQQQGRKIYLMISVAFGEIEVIIL